MSLYGALMSAEVVVPTVEPPRIDDVERLRPYVAFRAGVVVATMKAVGRPVRIIETARSIERQAWLYAAGRTRSSGIDVTSERPLGRIVTRARPGTSEHTPDEETGLANAFDVLFDLPNPWSEKHPWDLLGRVAEEVGLVWGGRWTNPRDLGHLQGG